MAVEQTNAVRRQILERDREQSLCQDRQILWQDWQILGSVRYEILNCFFHRRRSCGRPRRRASALVKKVKLTTPFQEP